MKSIAIITSFKPNKINQGNPSGLIDYLIQELDFHYSVSIFYLKCNSSLNKLGFQIPKNIIDLDSFDFIFVYPFYVIFSLQKKYYNKTFVLGPDATSLVWYRRSCLYSVFSPKYWLYNIVSFIFLYQESKVFARGANLIVVGQNDQNFLQQKRNINSFYLPHPIVENSFPSKFDSSGNKIFVISGHYSKDMVCLNSIRLIKKFIPNSQLIILGNKNSFLANYFEEFNVALIDFVQDYSEVCVPNLHIHLCPLAFGAGTKNRVLSALYYGCLVFGTDISNENINHPNLYMMKDLNLFHSIKSIDFPNYRNSVNSKFTQALTYLLK